MPGEGRSGDVETRRFIAAVEGLRDYFAALRSAKRRHERATRQGPAARDAAFSPRPR